jgi:hypothetical protein
MSTEAHTREELGSPGVGNRKVVAIAVGLMTMMVAAVAGFAALYVNQLPANRLPPPELFPAPRVQLDEKALRLRLQAEQRSRLSGYRWENGQKTLIGIPIERAMQILAVRGAKAYEPIAPSGEVMLAPGPAAANAFQSPDVQVPSNKEPRAAEKGLRQP